MSGRVSSPEAIPFPTALYFMKTLRMLIVEDEPSILEFLDQQYREVFAELGFSVTIEPATNGTKARDMAKAATVQPYDLVSLDVNLGDANVTGLDVLATLKRWRSAWMVAMLTGVETDSKLDSTMGPTKAEQVRRNLRRDAYAKFPAERLLVIEKPSSTLPSAEATHLLVNRIRQIALIYEEVARQRFIFRPIEVTSMERVKAIKGKPAKHKFIEAASLHWQIRFNCGELRTLPDRAGFRTLHRLLSMPRDEALTPEEALAIEPKNEVPPKSLSTDEDPVSAYFEAQGIKWSSLDAEQQDKLIQAALSLRIKRYAELRGFQDEVDNAFSAKEEDELNRIKDELGALLNVAELGYQRISGNGEEAVVEEIQPAVAMQEGLHVAGGNYERVGEDRRGFDSPAAQNFRARWKRAKDYLRENGFTDLAQHFEDYVQSTGASWSYNPPIGVEWTT